MKRSTAAVVGLGVIAAAVVGYLVFHRGGSREGDTARAAEKTAPQLHRPRGDRPENLGQGLTGGELPVLIDDDPAGSLRLEGQVVGDGDKPVAGAIVVVSSHPPRTAKTEDDGSFAFDHLVGRPYTLTARADQGIAGPVTARLTAKSDPVILHLRPAAAVDVTVVDPGGATVAGATVELRGTDDQQETASAKGVAHFAPVVPGRYDVVAYAPGFAHSYQPLRVLGDKVEVKIALAKGAPVAGKVVDGQGAPVADARVVFSGASDWSTQGDDRLDGVVTGKDGKFAFAALPAGSFRFVARHPDYAPGTSALVTLDGATPKGDVEIRLPAGATVRGTVVDASGAPVPSARVRIGVANAGMIGDSPRQVFSDDQGAFTVHGLPRRPLEAVALGESASSDTVPVDATAGDVDNVKLSLDQDGTIAGVVVDEAGNPLEGVQVSAFPDFRARMRRGGGGAGNMFAQWRLRGFPRELTDAGGKFTLSGLTKGTYRVRASRNQSFGRGRGFAGEGTSAETGTTDVRIVLPPEGGVKGKVAFADGTVPTAFTVGVGFNREPFSTADGSFQLDGLSPNSYALQVRGPGFMDKSVPVEVKGGRVADVGTITVAKGRVVAGTVVANGTPVPGATVYAGRQIFGNGSSSDARFGGGPPMAGGTRHTTTAQDGTFSMSGFGPGDLTVVAEEPNLGRSPAQRVQQGDPAEEHLTLAIQPYGAIKGTLASGGKPAENTIVTAQSTTVPGALYSVATGPDGAYRFDKLAPDTYKVSATLGMPMRGMKFYSKSVTVPAGQEVTVDLTYQPGSVSLTVDLAATGGAKVGSASVWLASGVVAAKNGRDLQLRLAAQGQGSSQWNIVPFGSSTQFTELEAGAYTACAMPFPDIPRRQMRDYAMKYADVMPVFCKTIQVAASPDQQSATVQVTVPPAIHDDGGGSAGGGVGGGAAGGTKPTGG